MVDRESESFIVLGDEESSLHGEGTAKPSQLAKGTRNGSRPIQFLQTSLLAITRKVKKDTKYRAGGLFGLLNPTNLESAYLSLNKKAAKGSDGISYAQYGTELKENLSELVRQLKQNSYRAKLVRRVHIPKGQGKTRPLGIPAIADKVLQQCASQILSGIYEEDFLPFSFGYRPHRGAKDAVMALRKEIDNHTGWVVEADICDFFGSIDHDWMIRMLEERCKDRPFINLIRKWLKAGILEKDGNVLEPASGTPQGGNVSPVLANIYLHYALDLWFHKVFQKSCKGRSSLVRYADDFVASFQLRADAIRFRQEMETRLAKFKLTLAKEKTNVIMFNRFRQRESGRVNFLGFEYRRDKSLNGVDVVKLRTTPKRLQKSARALKEWVKERSNKRLANIFTALNQKLAGYYNYFGVTGNLKSLNKFNGIVIRTVFRCLNRRSQRRSFSWPTFAKVIEHYGLLRPHITWGRDDQQNLAFT